VTIRLTTTVLLTFLLGGCGFFSAQKKDYFTIDAIPPAGARIAVQGLPVGIDTVQLPPAIERREVVVREESGQLNLRGRDLWGASLEALVMHALAFNLASRLPEGMVILPGQARPLGATRSIRVIAETFEAGPDQVVVLDARWILAGDGGAGTTTHERIEVPIGSLESADIANGMSLALAELSNRIAAAL
jgi:uncharacterized lipoprotein YmbA